MAEEYHFCRMEEKRQKVALGLKLATDPRWVDIAEKNIEEILTDHAYCEQKAASNAITCIVKYPEYTDLVDEMVRICQEEMDHFSQVHAKLKERGFKLGQERRDHYVRDLSAFIKRGGSREQQLVDHMLFSAMIEARSCERFRLLSENISDPDLKEFYWDLMVSEAEHYTTFIGFARKYSGNEDVDARWKLFLEFEGELIKNYGKSETMHG
jgi:tRNA 2-(methylsulfanyl)-N6-isopentenyladenosine37 hydroxylase